MARESEQGVGSAGRKSLDLGTLGGLAVAIAGILAGLWLDGGSLAQVLQPTAMLIVFGGTFGAVLVQFPFSDVSLAFRRLRDVFLEAPPETGPLIESLLGYATRARRRGLLSLDAELEAIADPFLKKSLMLAIDGMSQQELRTIMEADLDSRDRRESQAAQVFEAAGGFAPTIGILGAVLGLIQVMQRLDNLGAVGRGIAVAFVATLYGVGSANLLLLPIAGKLRIRAREQQMVREMTLEAVLAILDGDSPRTLREKLGAFAAQSSEARPVRLAEVASR